MIHDKSTSSKTNSSNRKLNPDSDSLVRFTNATQPGHGNKTLISHVQYRHHQSRHFLFFKLPAQTPHSTLPTSNIESLPSKSHEMKKEATKPNAHTPRLHLRKASGTVMSRETKITSKSIENESQFAHTMPIADAATRNELRNGESGTRREGRGRGRGEDANWSQARSGKRGGNWLCRRRGSLSLSSEKKPRRRPPGPRSLYSEVRHAPLPSTANE